ncbi:MAG TPA: hypothetical protein PL048_16120 [Leptospiraceae bacterium]|nr:hypothetical protein [Leptospiraceae bacterium]HMZ60304.1 hypothetical protein [Leptospiraceae bacterium]HNF15468.1 hypothetical protein [Leptospiraceae bacterium]HNH06863.1 hypothetical protein [Leptospiraceae bacterium]HNI96744.1 hypothetical protein [Leptospiraceae bacterium]
MKKTVFRTVLAGVIAFFLSSGLSAKSHKGHKPKAKAQVCKCCGMKMEKGKMSKASKSAKLPQCNMKSKNGKWNCGPAKAKKHKKKHH